MLHGIWTHESLPPIEFRADLITFGQISCALNSLINGVSSC